MYRAAQLLLPHLLSTYQATLMAEDCACLLALKALDRALTMLDTNPRQHVAKGFLESTGYMWGSLWQQVQPWRSIHPVLIDGLLLQPDMVDPRCGPRLACSPRGAEGSASQTLLLFCRRLALSALHFAGSRTLSLEEEDPFHSASRLSRASHAAYCAYDPAFVVPAAAIMLQQGWAAAESVVRAGWLPCYCVLGRR